MHSHERHIRIVRIN